MHRHGSPNGGQEIEKEANDFASAFLMPRSSVLAYAPRFVTLDALIQLKQVWGVSVAALAYRMHKLNLLTEWQFREMFIQIARRGYRKNEPESMPRETSQVLAKVFSALRSEGVGKSAIASELHVGEEDLDEMVFGLVLNGVKNTSSLQQQTRLRAKTALKLISDN